jgi:type III pantothenate kinase
MTEGKRFILIDIGNSYIKAALYQDDKLMERLLIEKGQEEKIVNLVEGGQISGIMISASGNSDIEERLQLNFPQIPVFQLHCSHVKDVKLSYAQPENLGKDRLAAILGARIVQAQKNICIVQAGTCLTIDWLFKDGNHMGGTISPGLKMRFKSMHEFTAKLPLSTENELLGFIGESTVSCLASGVIYGMVAEIEFQLESFKNQIGDDVELILTGGDVNNLAHRLKPSNFVVPDLVFLGMLKILKSLI